MNNFTLKFNTYYRLRWIEYTLLFLVLFLSFYFGMSTYAIENINEGLCAEIPREMLQIGNYIIPNLNFVPYIKNPPLFYWLIALTYKIFGISEWSARIVPATAAAFVCLSFVYFGHILRRNREGWLTAIILATSIGFIMAARTLIFDMVLTVFFTSALLAFYAWYKTVNANYLRLFYLFTGFAFLTKGMLAVLLIPSIAFTFLISLPNRTKLLFRFFDPIGLSLFAIIIIPWHYLALKQKAGFIWDFVDKQIANEHHTVPVYVNLRKIFVYLLPWSLLSFLFFKRDKSVEKTLYRFLWLWFFIPTLFFNIVVGIPPLAMLLALKINQIFHFKTKKTLLYFFCVLGILETLAFGLFYFGTSGHAYTANYLPDIFKLDISLLNPLLFMFIGVSAVTILGLLICLKYPRTPLLHFSGIITLVGFLIVFYVIDKQKIEYRHSEMYLAHYIMQHDPNRPVYLYKDYDKLSSLLFYLKKRVYLIESKSKNLSYGMGTSGAKGWFFSLNNFVEARDREAHYVVAKKESFLEFIHSVPSEYCIVAQSGSSVLLSNKPQDCGI